MYSEKAIQTLNALIGGQLEQGITTDLINHLRGGHASYINQKTWLILADFLDAGCKRPGHRPPTGESQKTRLRNLKIKQEYKQLRMESKSQKVAYGILAKQHNLGENTINNIITGP